MESYDLVHSSQLLQMDGLNAKSAVLSLISYLGKHINFAAVAAWIFQSARTGGWESGCARDQPGIRSMRCRCIALLLNIFVANGRSVLAWSVGRATSTTQVLCMHFAN